MKPLPATSERELLSILDRARANGRPLDRRQAALDCAGIIGRLPAAVAAGAAKTGRGRKPSAIRVLTVLAADTYFHHAGKGPGSTVNDSGKLGGHYPKFVGALARAAGLQHDPAALPALCNEVRKALSREAGLGRSRGLFDHAEREAARVATLKPHILGYEDLEGNAVDDGANGLPAFGGYEPAPRHVSTKRRFGTFLKGLR